MSHKPLAVLLATAFAALGGATPALASGSVSSDLLTLASHQPRATTSVIVQFERSVAPRQALALVRAAGGHALTALPIINGVSATLSARAASALTQRAGVRAVTVNGAVRSQSMPLTGLTGLPVNPSRLRSTYPLTVGAPASWMDPRRPLTGKGVGVAVIDTGIDGDLPDFRNPDGSSRVVESAVTNPNAGSAADLYGHGTHVAGIIAGNGYGRSPSDPQYGQYIGIAPGANLISVKAGDDQGNATVLDVINGLQFVVDHRFDDNIRIVNLSLSSSVAQSYKTDPLDAAVEAAWNHGIVVVAAAGNRGNTARAVDYAPGNDPYAITVGATDENGSADASQDTPASWSSVGVTQDGFAKPDLSAPGAHIVSTLAPGSAFAHLCPACLVGSGYMRVGGTSMAAPVVSGAAALLLQRFPLLTPDVVKALLVHASTALAAGGPRELSVPGALKPGLMAPANSGLTPNSLIDPVTGLINYARSSWSRSSWSSAPSSLIAGWARSSWTCSCLTAAPKDDGVDPSRSTWSTATWASTGPFAEAAVDGTDAGTEPTRATWTSLLGG